MLISCLFIDKMDLFLCKSVCITMFKKIFYIFYFIFPQSCFTIGVVKTEHRGDGMDNEQLWNKFLTQIQIKILQPFSFNSWLKPTKLLGINGNSCIVEVESEFQKNFLARNYTDLMSEVLYEITNVDYDFEFVLKSDNHKEELPQNDRVVETKNLGKALEIEHKKLNSNLNPKYTFDNFIVGDTNRFACSSAQAVAENPGKIYNPLFIYGKSGLGKTHLMHAIGNRISSNSDKVVLYVTSSEFIADFTGMLRKDKNVDNYEVMNNFKEKYRNIDVLIIDDIQFLAGADKSQDEFFHTFTELYDSNKQIIISSDRSPDDLKLLEERLLTRFRWGLTANIYPPDFALRCQILRNKMMGHEVAKLVDDRVIEYIASNCENDVRQLEGAINRLYAYAAIMVPNEINVDFATEALKGFLGTSMYITNNIQRIQRAVAEYFNLSVEDLKSKKRTANINYARQIGIYLSQTTTDETLVKIGLEFGNRDHSTVIHACDKIAEDINTNRKLKDDIENIKNKIVN